MSETLRQPSESSVESASNSGEKKDTKEKKKKTGYLGLVAAEGSPDGIVSKDTERRKSVWDSGAGEKKLSFESLLSGRDTEAGKAGEKDGGKEKRPNLRVIEGGKEPESDAKAATEGGETDAEKVPLDELSRQEALEAVTVYTEPRKKELAERVASQTAGHAANKVEKPVAADGAEHQVPDGDKAAEKTAGDETADVEAATAAAEEAETAANAVFIESIDQEIAENPDRSVEEVLEAAEARTTAVLAAEAATETAPAEDSAVEEAPEPIETVEPVVMSTESTGAETDPYQEDDDTVLPTGNATSGTSVATTGGAGGSSGGPAGPGGPGSPGGPSGPGGPGNPNSPYAAYNNPYGPGGGGGYTPPRGPGHGTAGFNTAPAAANVITQDITAERNAMAQGFLVGGILGYLIGKRRGRIKTEKRLIPIQKKLEKEVRSLHDSVALKEQAIRKVAAEKTQSLKTVEAKHQFAERLRQQSAERAAANAKIRQKAAEKLTRNEAVQGSRTERSVDAAIIHERVAAGRAPAEVLRPLVVDVPAVILGGVAALRPERATYSTIHSRPDLQGRQTIRAEDIRGERPVIDFTKQVETYSTEELKQAAEKIKVDENTTLKELYDDGRLNENAVRRILKEFVEGRSVRAAISNELLEKERKFERDPNLRQQQTAAGGPAGPVGGGSGAHGVGLGGLAAGGAAGDDPMRTAMTGATAIAGVTKDEGTGSNGSGGSSLPKNGKPTPDKATLDRIRKQQAQQVAAATGVAAAGIAGLIAFLI